MASWATPSSPPPPSCTTTPFHIPATKMASWILLLVITIIVFFSTSLGVAAQQSYPSTFETMDCTVHHTDNAGYLCSDAPAARQCQTLAYYRVQSNTAFNTLTSIASDLFGTNASAIAKASNLSSANAQLSNEQPLFVPLDCQCGGNHSSYNITYTIQPGDTFVHLANATYEGLTTCQAIQDANPTAQVYDLQIGQTVTFPVRCACLSQTQISSGYKLLVTYPVQDGDNVSTIATMFGVSVDDFLAANNLTSPTVSLFPATTVLVPMRTIPTTPPASSSSTPVTSSSSPPQGSRSSKTGLYIGVSVAAAAVLIFLLLAALWFIGKKRRASKAQILPPSRPVEEVSPIKTSKLQGDLLVGMSDFAGYEKLTAYSVKDLKEATLDFSPSTHIMGAVYRGVIKGQVVAIKHVTRNVSKELQILQKVHHANLVTLLGACISGPEQSYLVYEYAENGSLSDWLHEQLHSVESGSTSSLTWNTRLQIALDIATGLQYLHDHTNPSFVHKGIKSSNILLDSKFRGKIANFGLAKSTEDMEQGSALTRHIVGTQGYMAPEYLTHGMVSPKMDVFAFGVVLLEMLSGEDAIIRGQDRPGKEGFLSESIGPLLEGDDAKEKLKGWMDSHLQNAYPLDCAYSVAILARSCVDDDPSSRPIMRDIAYMLAKLLETSLEWEPSTVLDENYTDNPLEAR